MIDQLKEILRKGNVTKIVIKKDGNVILNLPVNAAILGGIISAPPLTLIGFGSAVLAKCVIEVEKEGGEIININNLVDRNEDF